MQKVRAKFVCNAVKDLGDNGARIQMTAVTSGSEENESFSKFTPSGNFSMDIDPSSNAAALFVQGEEYYFDITHAPTES